MKKTITLLALTISFIIRGQISTSVTDNSGIYASAIGYTTTASGYASTATGGYTISSNFYSTAMGRSTTASGGYSTSMGYFTTATGDSSVSMGSDTVASGYASTAMGKRTTASGNYSTASGYWTTASGYASTVMGVETIASDYASTVIGHYNSSGSSPTSADSFSTAAPAFVIGNGTYDATSDAFKVMFNGDAYVSNSLYLGGTEITATAAEINLLSGVTSIGTGVLSPVTEGGKTGVRLSTVDPENYGDIGQNAIDLSSSSSESTVYGATGDWSSAIGYSTTAIGDYSTAMGGYTTASGPVSTAMGDGTTASGIASTAMGQGTTASGDYSTAIGENTTASGETSTAMGYQSTASGIASTAMGKSTASGTYSTAMGYDTVASGIGSTAMGRSIASDFASTVIGQYNSSGSSPTSADSFSTAAPAFVIGNGTASDATSDAFKVMFNGDAYVSNSLYLGGTEITATATEINLLSGVTTLGTGVLSPVTEGGNTGVRLSTVDPNHYGDIGNYAVDLSYSGPVFTTGSTGDYSTAMGNGTTASGDNSTAMGYYTTSSGYASTAMGNLTTASEPSSTAMGLSTEASGFASTAMGQGTTAMGQGTTAMGYFTTASGFASTAMGNLTTASDFGSLVIGQYNLLGSTVTNSDTMFNTENTAFVIGNGADAGNRSDALTVLFDGTTTIAGDLSINSDARLKANIISLGSTLAKVLQIDGKSYTMKKDDNKKQKIGVLAQDIEKVFPELVSESNGIKSVNYQGLVPVLINALKEQDTKMNKQQAEIDELKEMVQALVSRE